ncbi:diaminopimelate decarboxylase [Massilia sp. W12]|uniref:diaminopimelate decarboxylase n=1 Tax=Massilia sp. W12 TaxID=3126507 RepID=UPI0030CCBA58
MSHFHYQNGELYAEQLALSEVAAQFGTPCYVYSRAALQAACDSWQQACQGRDSLICYSVKSNSNLAILHILAKQGFGFDIVSGGELRRVLAAGGAAQKVIFSGVGKSREEIRFALQQQVACFNVESASELLRINQIAGELGCRAPISLRVNPDVDAQTHPYISTGLKENKFGIAYEEALPLYRMAAGLPHLQVHGIDCHIGSQLLDDAPLLAAFERIALLVDTLAAEGIHLQHLDIGGGLGIRYTSDQQPVPVGDYLQHLFARIDAWRARSAHTQALRIVFEPGRSIIGNCGLLLSRVEYLKHGAGKNFAIVDAAMNDLLRPALYQAWHEVLPLQQHARAAQLYDIVGPVCESADWLARARELALQEDDLLAFMSAGAYGMTMSSNYNTRARAAEVLVDGAQMHLIREREQLDSLFALEKIPF